MQAPQSPTEQDEKTEEECIAFIKPFIEEGLPGLHRLYQVLPNVFKDHNIVSLDKQEEILVKSGLTPDVLQSFAKEAQMPDEPCSGKTPADCTEYIQTFLRSGVPGIARLKQVLPSLFKYFKVMTSDEKANILIKCGLTPYKDESEVTFFFRGDECRDPLKAPRSVSYEWDVVRDSDNLSPTSEVCHE